MASDRRLGGIITIEANGEGLEAAGEFTWNVGAPKREALMGPATIQGFKENIQVPFIEGTIRDFKNLKVVDLLNLVDATITLVLASGKSIVLSEAWFAGDGNVTTDEGAIDVRFEGISAKEVR